MESLYDARRFTCRNVTVEYLSNGGKKGPTWTLTNKCYSKATLYLVTASISNDWEVMVNEGFVVLPYNATLVQYADNAQVYAFLRKNGTAQVGASVLPQPMAAPFGRMRQLCVLNSINSGLWKVRQGAWNEDCDADVQSYAALAANSTAWREVCGACDGRLGRGGMAIPARNLGKALPNGITNMGYIYTAC